MYSTGNGRIDEELVYLHQQDLLKEAEHYRLVQQALGVAAGKNHGMPIRARAANWLGYHFIDLGNALLAFSPNDQARQQGC